MNPLASCYLEIAESAGKRGDSATAAEFAHKALSELSKEAGNG